MMHISSIIQNSGFGSATATTTTIINTGGGTTGLMTSSSAGALTGNHNTNQVITWVVTNFSKTNSYYYKFRYVEFVTLC